jgi:hypothetical protein
MLVKAKLFDVSFRWNDDPADEAPHNAVIGVLLHTNEEKEKIYTDESGFYDGVLDSKCFFWAEAEDEIVVGAHLPDEATLTKVHRNASYEQEEIR